MMSRHTERNEVKGHALHESQIQVLYKHRGAEIMYSKSKKPDGALVFMRWFSQSQPSWKLTLQRVSIQHENV